MREHKRVGVLLECNPGTYSRALRTNITLQARSFELDVGFLEVDWPTQRDQARPTDLDGTLRHCEQFDALVVLAGVYSQRIDVLSRFAQHWAPRPLVSIGYRLPATPSVLIDNRGGQKVAVLHLIDVHGCKQPLYVRGRKENLEADERYLGYRRGLNERGILFDKDLVIQGDFTGAGGLRALAALSNRIAYDGIVAANDDMAIAIVSELLRRSIDVPKDLPVIGFDDIHEAQSAIVPLTTMVQPFDALAREAMSLLKRQLMDEAVEPLIKVPVKLVVRKSCGC